MPSETPNTQADDTPFATWWIASNLEQVLENYEAAYGLTNAIDALLGNLFTRVFDPDHEQAARIRRTIARVVPVICQRLPVAPNVAAQGLSAADQVVYHKWIAGDWQSLPPMERRRMTARMKILRNVCHAIALDDEIGDNTSVAAVRQAFQFLETGIAAKDCLSDIVIGLRLLASAHAAGDLDRSNHSDLKSFEPTLYAVANRLLDAPGVPIGRDDVLHGVCAAIGMISAPLMPADERETDRDNDVDRMDHVSMLASKLDVLWRERRITERGDGFRQEYRAIEARALRGDGTMH